MKAKFAAPLLLICAYALTASGSDRKAGETRTVSGAFTTVYRPDDGTTTILSTPPPFGQAASALLVPDDSPTGYTAFPVTLEADNTFTVPGVPVGSYFLQLDTMQVLSFPPFTRYTTSALIELTADSPDLSLISAARPDLARVTVPTPVSLDISGMLPWQSGNQFLISSSQADVSVRPSVGGLSPPPQPGITAYQGTFDWNLAWVSVFAAGLPNAAKGDVTYINQRSTLPIGIGDSAAELRYASRYARVTDFTVTDGSPATLSAKLLDTQQTGRLRTDVRGSQFAALAADVHPTARPTANNMALSVIAVPHSAEYPDMPGGAAGSSIFYFQSLTTTATDFDYGTLAYPQFHDQVWTEFRQVFYSYDLTLLTPGTKEPIEFRNFLLLYAWAPMSPPPVDPVAPRLGPPTAPLINGEDAFGPHSGVGVQPVLSWSPPSVGTATSYFVWVGLLEFPPHEGDTLSITATLYSGNSFRVPAGFLQPGRLYYATITANQAPWDSLDRPPFRQGAPVDHASCVTGIFIP